MPGLITASNNLFENAALLSQIKMETPPQLLGTNTVEALLAGIVKGHAYAIDGFVVNIKKEYKDLTDIKTIATGGIAGLIAEQSKTIDVVDKDLTLAGLAMIGLRDEV
jgi:type III pantothenate kinase